MRAYYIENNGEVGLDLLKDLGVLYWKLDADNWEQEGLLDKIRSERSYKNHDVVNISRKSLGDIYDTKLKTFFEEHLHEDEEIRFILDGSGYFDVRDKSEEWIRLAVEKGDLIVLPAGIYHRFTVDDKEYTKAMRLFQDEPKWTPLNRDLPTTNSLPARQKYAAAVGLSA